MVGERLPGTHSSIWVSHPYGKQISYITEADAYAAQAPGEAEAELAMLNRAGFVDTVLTDDSDIFVFGVRTVIRKYVIC